jgi:phosphoadenosine phosphosulfate reductase
MESEAIDFLRRYEPDEGYYLADSGGKDSRVLRKLADLSGVKYQAFYSHTTIDPPEIPKFIRTHFPNTISHYPAKSFYQYIREWLPPTRNRRWC